MAAKIPVAHFLSPVLVELVTIRMHKTKTAKTMSTAERNNAAFPNV